VDGTTMNIRETGSANAPDPDWCDGITPLPDGQCQNRYHPYCGAVIHGWSGAEMCLENCGHEGECRP
jgi:hypothetical protein